MNTAPFFSIGITTYDRVDMLKEALGSILRQTFGDFEVIVSNDNPSRAISGESLGIADSRIKFVNQKQNLGEYNNMLYLLNAGAGKYFTWLADDDVYLPEFLQVSHDTLEKSGFLPCLFTSFDYYAPQDRAVEENRKKSPESVLLSGPEFLDLYFRGKIRTISVMGLFKREFLKALGGLDDVSADGKGLFCEYMLLLKTAASTDEILYVDAPLVLYRSHPEAWGNINKNVAMYERAAENLTRESVNVLCRPEFRKIFSFSLYRILQIGTGSYVSVLRRSGQLSFTRLLSYLAHARRYIRPLKGTGLYFAGLLALFKAELRLILGLIWHGVRRAR